MSPTRTLHHRWARWFVLACQASLVCLLTCLVLSAVEAWLLPRSLDAVMASGRGGSRVLAVLLPVLLVLVPVAVPVIAMCYLVLSMLVGHELDSRELRWSAFAVLICGLGLGMFLVSGHCHNNAADGAACRAQVALFVVDQFSHGSFADVFDVFDIKLTSIEFDSLTAWGKLFALNFRMLCAVTVVSLLMRGLGGPLERLAQWSLVPVAQYVVGRAFWLAVYVSGACLVVGMLALALEPGLFPGYFDRLAAATDLPSQILRLAWLSASAAIAAVVPLLSLAYLLLSLLLGQVMRGREFVWFSLALLLSAAGLGVFIEQSACTGMARQLAACAAEVPGYVFDQFYKGAFADVFDVYPLKLGAIDISGLSFVDKLLVLNFRLLSAVVGVSVLLTLKHGWSERKHRKLASKIRAATVAPYSPADAWIPTIFADTLPMQR